MLSPLGVTSKAVAASSTVSTSATAGGGRARPPSYSLTPSMGSKAQTMIEGLAELGMLSPPFSFFLSIQLAFVFHWVLLMLF